MRNASAQGSPSGLNQTSAMVSPWHVRVAHCFEGACSEKLTRHLFMGPSVRRRHPCALELPWALCPCLYSINAAAILVFADFHNPDYLWQPQNLLRGPKGGLSACLFPF